MCVCACACVCVCVCVCACARARVCVTDTLALSTNPTRSTRQDGDGGEEDDNFDPGYEPDWAVISTVKRAREPVPVRDTGEDPVGV